MNKKRHVFIPIGPSIAYIPLTRGQYSLIDSDDAAFAATCNWSAHWKPSAASFYARGWVDTRVIGLHRALICPADGMDVDHINGMTLDNRRANLREATRSQNASNGRLRRNSSTGVAGVCWVTRFRKYVAYIRVNGKRVSLGYFNLLDEAKAARHRAEVEYFGEFRRVA